MPALAASLINTCFLKEGEKWGRWGLPSHPSTWVPKPAKQVKVLFFYKGNEQEMEAQVSGPRGHKEAQKGWKFPAVGCCFPPQGSQLHHVCDQWEDGALPDPGDPQPPGPCQKGRGCWYCRNHFYSINSGYEGAGNRETERALRPRQCPAGEAMGRPVVPPCFHRLQRGGPWVPSGPS